MPKHWFSSSRHVINEISLMPDPEKALLVKKKITAKYSRNDTFNGCFFYAKSPDFPGSLDLIALIVLVAPFCGSSKRL